MMTRLILLVIFTFAFNSAHAHGDEKQPATQSIQVELQVLGGGSQFYDAQGQQIKLIEAYLSLFSVELIPCIVPSQTSLGVDWTNPFHWFFSQAYANHGVSFNKPTQIPLMRSINLLEGNLITLDKVNLPRGQYCSMNMTFAKNSHELKTPLQVRANRHSLYFAKTDGSVISAKYAFGKTTEFKVTINKGSRSLRITLDPKTWFKTSDFTQQDAKVIRGLFLNVFDHIKVM